MKRARTSISRNCACVERERNRDSVRARRVRDGVQPCGPGRGAELGEAGPPHHRGSLHWPRYTVQHAFQGAHDDPHREGQGDGAQPGDIAVQRVSPPQILGRRVELPARDSPPVFFRGGVCLGLGGLLVFWGCFLSSFRYQLGLKGYLFRCGFS